MDNRLLRAVKIFKSSPNEENAMRLATLYCRLVCSDLSMKKVKDLEPLMKSCKGGYSRLTNALYELGLTEETSLEELASKSSLDIIMIHGIGVQTAKSFFNAVHKLGYRFEDSWYTGLYRIMPWVSGQLEDYYGNKIL